MFTTGSKLFFGASALALVSALVLTACTDGPLSSAGVLGLISVSAIFGFLGGVNYANRDCNVSGMDDSAPETASAAQRAGVQSAWPAAAALGVAGLVVGAVSKPVVFKVAVVVVLAATVEWMVLGLSARVSDNDDTNANTRRRLLYPLEFPILAAAALGAIVYAFSRVMLRLDQDPGKVVFGVVAALVLFGAFVFSHRRTASKRTVVGITTLGAVALFGVGVASAMQGQRTIEAHPTTVSEQACLEAGPVGEVDEHTSQDVSAKSSVLANVYLKSDGSLVALLNVYDGQPRTEMSVPRGTQVHVLFHNESSEERRLTARLGTFGDSAESLACTTLVHEGKEAFLEFKIGKPNAASASPLVLMVPGTTGEIQIVVP